MSNKDFFFLLVRLILGYIFLSSGLCKLTEGQFGQLIGPPLLIEQLKEYNLELFAYVVAISQVMVGALVMTQRFSLIGLIALFPINFSILSVTVSMHWVGTPYVNSFFLLLNLAALLYEYPSLKILLVGEESSTAKVPRSIQLFPDVRLALVLLGLIAVSIGLTFVSVMATTIVASIFFLLLLYFLLQTSYYRLQQLVLVCFTLSILGVTNVRYLFEIGIGGQWIFIGAFVVGFLAWLVSLFYRIENKMVEVSGSN